MKHTPEIVYSDEQLLIVNKPPKLLTIPDRYDTTIPNLYHLLLEQYGEVYVVHRLDRETSGILCFARTRETHAILSRQFEQRTIQKTYLILVDGHLAEKEGVIDAPIAESPATAGKMIVSRMGKASITHYRVVEEFKSFSLVEADIKTGRQHQLRVHFAHIGHPPVVDSMYNRRKALYLSDIKNKYKLSKLQDDEQAILERVPLHAYRLVFEHPTSNNIVNFTVEPPKDFRATLQQLRKWGK